MNEKIRIKKEYEFNNVIKSGKYLKNSCYIIYYKKNNKNTSRFGISVGKKLGNAVFRNLYKRRIRNIINTSKKNYQNGIDYIIIMRKGCIDIPFKDMENNLNNLMISIK